MANTLMRNAAIVKKYANGETLGVIGKQFGLSRSRISQIVRSAGFSPKMRYTKSDGRDQFLGVNISAEVKTALRREAKRRGLSVSKLTSQTIKQMLVDCGYEVEAAKINL